MLFAARARGFLSTSEQAYALAETLLGVALWLVLAVATGGLVFLFAFVLPLLVANAIVMGFILTNHSLSPLTGVNDPLLNSLSVTTPRLVEWLTLGFGYHVEHHLFPAMSARHAARGARTCFAPTIRENTNRCRYCRATAALHGSARVYKDASTLVDPRSGREWPVLQATEVDATLEPVILSAHLAGTGTSTAAAAAGAVRPTRPSRVLDPSGFCRDNRRLLSAIEGHRAVSSSGSAPALRSCHGLRWSSARL